MERDIELFPQRGELAALIRERDWSTSPLGPQSGWSPSLRTVLRLMLASRYAMWMGWGPDLNFFYNDAYSTMTLGAKHPWALGRPAREVWREIWPTIGVRIEHVLRTGEATWDEGLRLLLERSGYPEETYHTFSYSPVPGDDPGEIAGLFCVVVEETERVIGERRMSLLRELASSLGPAKTAADVYAAVERCLAAGARDFPFALTYAFSDDGRVARRVSQSGFSAPHPGAPEEVDVEAPGPWPLAAVLARGVAIAVDLAPAPPWPTGPWERPPSRALAVPIAKPGDTRPAGVFVAGLNPHRPVDAGVRSFVELFVGQLAAGLSNAGAYEEARRRAEALAEIDRAKTAFFSNVSHEFRTPLTLMLGPTEDALATPDRALRGAELETVYRNELRLLKLVNALLEFARIEAGRIQASYQASDLAAFTVDLASTFRSAIERAGLRFEVACDPLPESIWIDRDMWEKVVLNLLSNALKFTFEGAISVGLRWAGDHAELTVRDSGVGIAAHELPRLFERFHRIEGGRARTHEGSGIGLALVHELVRLHGGTIAVDSELGVGSRFTVAIPRGTAHLPPERIDAPRTLASTSAGAAYVEEALRWMPAGTTTAPARAPDPAAARILVVDDNADMRDYIARILRAHWSVEAVADGVAALEAARRARPDLVISDVMMPRLDGFGLLRELRGDPRTAGIPTILLSARAGEEATADGLRAGADDYLVKPFSASALLVRVEAQLSAARLRETLRRRAELERERLETLFREAPAAMVLVRGRELVVEIANPRVLEIWGKGPDIIGKPLLEALPELRGQGIDELLLRVLDSGEVVRGADLRARIDRRGDGTLEDVYFDFAYVPVRGAGGEVDAVFVHAYDVTDQVVARRHIEELRAAEQRARQDAEAANRLKDEFLATMSHELRTPLNAILGWASLLARGAHDPRSVARALATIERNARAQARLIDDVLDVSRIVSGKLRLDMRAVDPAAIARAALDVVRPAAEAKRVRLEVDLAWPAELRLVGDGDRLQQVLWNLLSNAVKFTPPEGAVELRLERAGDEVRFVVADSGVGISAEHLPVIFDRFRQVDSSPSRKHGGLGLGLAIVRHLVELHGGAVVATSPGPGGGATFTVTLPMRAELEADASPRAAGDSYGGAAASPAGVRLTPLSGVRALIVEDDDDARVLLASVLERAGASVTAAGSARAALALLDAQPIDVLISDIGMPDEDGFALMRRVRERPAERGGGVPAIALSAYARPEDVARALDVGFTRHLAKPANLDELTRVVASLVHGG